MQKRLYRSRHDQVIGGVCGGIADYFGIDAVLIRLLAVAAILIGGGGLLAYIIMWVVIPEEPRRSGEESDYEPRRPRSDNGSSQKVFGVALICFGAYMALEEFIPWNIGEYFWPAVLILGGVFILFRGKDEA